MTSVLTLVLALAPQGTDLWPVGDGETTPVLFATYGQLENCHRECEEGQVGGNFHTGIDIAAAAGTPVFAIHAGVVRKVSESTTDPLWTHMVVESDGHPGNGFMYGHIDEMQFSADQHVEAGDLLGYAMAWREPSAEYPCESDVNYDHLHLAWVDPMPSDDWTRPSQDAGNPLEHLPVPNDGLKPKVHSMSCSGPFGYKRSTEYDEPIVALTDRPWVGELDIVACVSDRIDSGAKWAVAPHVLTLKARRLDGASEAQCWRIEFTGRLPGILNMRGTYACGSVGAHDPLRRHFHFVLTNGASCGTSNGIAHVLHGHAWNAQPGEYELTLTARDFAGNQEVVREVVRVE